MIIFFCPYMGFPHGTAPTGRLTGYAKGLTKLGQEVFIILPDTSEHGKIIFNSQVKGNIDGINFEYTCGSTVRPASFFRRRFLTVKGMIVASIRFLQLSSKNKIDAVIVYPDRFFSTLWFWFLARIKKIPLLLEKSEHPYSAAGRKPKSKIYQFLYTSLILRRFDGVMVVSHYLQDYLKGILSSHTRFVLIPIFVDFDSFEKFEGSSASSQKYITYCGLLNEAKDGVQTLMKAFKDIHKDYPDMILRLVGDSYSGTKIPEYKKYAEELGILDCVDFVGMVSRDVIPKYLKESTILSLARPTSLQAQAGFPSKVGEYLASGKPLVITRTGELDSYLVDGKNVYFSEPDDYKKFADRLRYVLDHLNEACEVGLMGQKLAKENFDYLANAKRLLAFIDSFSTN